MPETSQIPVPDLADPLFAPFWDGTRAGELRIQCCTDCGTHRWPPRFTCRKCQSLATDWVAVEPRGTIYSWTTVGRPTAKGFSEVPYVVGIVALDGPEGVRIVGNVVDIEPAALAIGTPVAGLFTAAGPAGDMTLVHWVPVKA